MATAGEAKYLDVSHRLEAAIAEGRWAVGRIPGVREIAAEHGISAVTASRALHVLRDKGLIRSVHRSGHFVVGDRGPAAGPADPVRRWALCFRTTPGPWQRAAWSVTMGGFEAVAAAGRDAFSADAFGSLDDATEAGLAGLVGRAVAGGISGVFLLPSRTSDASTRREELFLAACGEGGLPAVLIERNLRGDGRPLEWDLAATDDIEGGFRCARHLLDSGRRRVAFVHGSPTSSHNDRLAGYLLALARSGGASAPVILEHRLDLPSREALAMLADRIVGLGVDGVACYQDTVAIGLVLEFLARRMRIPEDLAIVGYDDLPIGSSFSLGLTTYALDARRMAAEAVRLMERRIGDPAASPIKVLVPGRLVVRESSPAGAGRDTG